MVVIVFPKTEVVRPCGAMVARLTPDQKAGCSSHSGVKVMLYFFIKNYVSG